MKVKYTKPVQPIVYHPKDRLEASVINHILETIKFSQENEAIQAWEALAQQEEKTNE